MEGEDIVLSVENLHTYFHTTLGTERALNGVTYTVPRGKVLGINVAAVYVGLSVGPFVGGFLTQYFSWRSVFLVTLPMGLFIIFLIFSRLKGEKAKTRFILKSLTSSMGLFTFNSH